MTLHPEVRILLNEIAAFRKRTGLNRTMFGRIVMHDGNFIDRLERGRVPKLTTLEYIRAFIRRSPRARRKRKVKQ